jgi:hypothetical protein
MNAFIMFRSKILRHERLLKLNWKFVFCFLQIKGLTYSVVVRNKTYSSEIFPWKLLIAY